MKNKRRWAGDRALMLRSWLWGHMYLKITYKSRWGQAMLKRPLNAKLMHYMDNWRRLSFRFTLICPKPKQPNRSSYPFHVSIMFSELPGVQVRRWGEVRDGHPDSLLTFSSVTASLGPPPSGLRLMAPFWQQSSGGNPSALSIVFYFMCCGTENDSPSWPRPSLEAPLINRFMCHSVT